MHACVFKIRTYDLSVYLYFECANSYENLLGGRSRSLIQIASVVRVQPVHIKEKKNEEINLLCVASVDAFCKYTTKTEEEKLYRI